MPVTWHTPLHAILLFVTQADSTVTGGVPQKIELQGLEDPGLIRKHVFEEVTLELRSERPESPKWPKGGRESLCPVTMSAAPGAVSALLWDMQQCWEEPPLRALSQQPKAAVLAGKPRKHLARAYRRTSGLNSSHQHTGALWYRYLVLPWPQYGFTAELTKSLESSHEEFATGVTAPWAPFSGSLCRKQVSALQALYFKKKICAKWK